MDPFNEMTFPHVKFASASFCSCFFQCHLPLLFPNHSGGTNVPFVADAVLRLSKRCGCLHRHLGLVRTSWALTAIFTLVAELPHLLPAGFAVCTSWP